MEEVLKGMPKSKRRGHDEYRDLRWTHVADVRGRNLAVSFDPRGKCHYGRDEVYGDHIIAILGEQVSDEYLAELREDGVSYLFAGRDGHDIQLALEILGEAFGAKTLVLQGGAVINGAFLKAGMIDEISLLVFPAIDGLSGGSTIFECAGRADSHPAAGQSLRLLETEALEGGVVWLHYRVEKAA